jgi:hypothetical protein
MQRCRRSFVLGCWVGNHARRGTVPAEVQTPYSRVNPRSSWAAVLAPCLPSDEEPCQV